MLSSSVYAGSPAMACYLVAVFLLGDQAKMIFARHIWAQRGPQGGIGGHPLVWRRVGDYFAARRPEFLVSSAEHAA